MPEPVAALEGVSKIIASRSILSGISATVESGNVIGLLGKNGSGKTTLLEILLGLSLPSSGRATLFGECSQDLSEVAKSRVGFAPQHDELVETLSGAQQLRTTASFHRAWDHRLVERLSADWQVPLDRRIGTMSVGERQKLSLLLALGHRPELLVLDEPMASLDPVARRSFLRELIDLLQDSRSTVLLSSHIVSDLERAANRIWIVKEGRIVWQGDLDELKESVVRLHILGRHGLPHDLAIPHALRSHVNGRRATVSVSQWNPATRPELEHRLSSSIEVEMLGLEEIFLEVHS